MAIYIATAKTNYFRVTDEEKYQELFDNLSAENIYDFTKTKDGVVYHGFGAYDSIDYINPDTEETDFHLFLEKIQNILPDDEAFVYFESGSEKLRYVTGYVAVCTSKTIETMTLSEWAMKQARYVLGSDFETQFEC